ncbi:MAG: DUF2304 domain-containing protein [Anaerolineae bacterium]|nr:DUF2304 domain-containing protein [Anaerolineae bacterium]
MSVQGIIFIDLLGIGFILLILNLVRTKRLHIAYATIWFLAVGGLMVMVSIPSLLAFLPRMMGAIYPASAVSLLAFVFIFLVLIFFSMQLTAISARQVAIIQALALRELLERDDEDRD